MATRVGVMIEPWLPLMAVIFGLGFWSQPAFDADLGFHLLGGAWIADHRAVPSADFINSFNPYWHDYHWLAQVVIYQLYRVGDYEMLRFGLGVLVGFLCKVIIDIVRLARRQPPPPAVSVLCFLWSLSLIDVFVAVRPQIASLCLLAITVRRLMQRPTAWELPFLFLVTVVAANIHIYWVLIPAFWGVSRCAPRFLGRSTVSSAHAWGGLAALSAAALVSPYGLIPVGERPPFVFMNYALVWEYLQLPVGLKNAIGEMKGSFANESFNPWLIVLYLVIVARTFSLRRALADIGNALAALLTAALAIYSVKFVPVFAIAGLPFLVRHGSVPLWHRLRVPRRVGTLLGTMAVGIVTVTALFSAVRHFPWIDNNNTVIAAYQPVGACRHIASLGLTPRAPRHHVRVLTHFNNGSWCRWSLHQAAPQADFRVTTDGRTQGVPVDHFLASFDLFNASGNWRQILAGWNPDVMVISRAHQLAASLAAEPARYQLVYQDDSFVVFVPLAPPAQGTTQKG
jgi:hypothetical protein